ncbi:hypothetical protein [Vreelandella sp.]|uniref:hypothetical protein n=1 Tax=Vreelandella sp. TaxID=3137778 RepID=UPI003BA97107
MKKIGLVLSAIFLTGCASTDIQDRSEDRYVFGLKSVESSELFLSSTLPEDLGYGEGVLTTAFSSYVAELDKTLGVVRLEAKPVYGDDSMEISMTFDYCDAIVTRDESISCDNVLSTYEEKLTFVYDELPSHLVLENGLRLEVSKFEM